MPALTSVSGFPRIGQNRELKKIIEAYWKGAASLDEVRGTAKELRAKHWKLQAQAGVDLIPSNDFSYYDQMLDTAILLNVIPQRYKRLAFTNPEETLFAMGRGYQGDKGDVTALPMKKWFTTNYHYIVPEIEESTGLGLKEAKAIVDGAPKAVKEKASKAEAEDIKKKLEDAGAKVEVK